MSVLNLSNYRTFPNQISVCVKSIRKIHDVEWNSASGPGAYPGRIFFLQSFSIFPSLFNLHSHMIGLLKIMQKVFMLGKSFANDVNHLLKRASHVQNFSLSSSPCYGRCDCWSQIEIKANLLPPSPFQWKKNNFAFW